VLGLTPILGYFFLLYKEKLEKWNKAIVGAKYDANKRIILLQEQNKLWVKIEM